jgi:hypothetical protein
LYSDGADVVRHILVQKIVEAYERSKSQSGAQPQGIHEEEVMAVIKYSSGVIKKISDSRGL